MCARASPGLCFTATRTGDPSRWSREGYLRSAAAELSYDTRNSLTDPSNGWWFRGSLERALGGSLRTRLDAASLPAPRRFWDASIDLRRYAQLGPSSRLAVRAALAGSLNGAALPAQRQHALGGEGSLPGFAMRRFDCGAQGQAVLRDNSSYQRYYGCDRAVLVQLEYQTDFKFLRRLRNTAVDQLGLLQRVRLAAFFDAGRAWNENAARRRPRRRRRRFRCRRRFRIAARAGRVVLGRAALRSR